MVTLSSVRAPTRGEMKTRKDLPDVGKASRPPAGVLPDAARAGVPVAHKLSAAELLLSAALISQSFDVSREGSVSQPPPH
jgi:hypothetical protein